MAFGMSVTCGYTNFRYATDMQGLFVLAGFDYVGYPASFILPEAYRYSELVFIVVKTSNTGLAPTCQKVISPSGEIYISVIGTSTGRILALGR